MGNKGLIVLLLAISLCFPSFIFAETIILKSGKKVEGKIIKKTDKYIQIDFPGVPLTYFLDEIESIDGKRIPVTAEDTPTVTPEVNKDYSRVEKGVQEDSQVYFQKDGLFKIDVLPGWNWIEKPGDIMITNPKGDNGISIQFKPAPVESDEKAKEALKKGNQAMITALIKPFLKGTVIGEAESSVDGVYARKLDYLFPLGDKTSHGTYISLFYKAHAFTITFGARQQSEERFKMEKIVETFKFQ